MPLNTNSLAEEEDTKAERFRIEEESRVLEEHSRKMRHQDLRPHLALQKLRKSLRNDDGKKLSQREMAEILGVSLRGYQNYEHGDRPIPSDVLTKIKAYFEVPAETLLSDLVLYSDLEKVDQLVDDVFDLIQTLIAEYEALRPHDLRLIVKDALSQRDQDRVLSQDPDAGFDLGEIQQNIRKSIPYYQKLWGFNDDYPD